MFSGPMFVILMVMMVTLVVMIVLGNALVILAFKVDKSLRRQCNYYFLNLAISDFLVGKSNSSLFIDPGMTKYKFNAEDECVISVIIIIFSACNMCYDDARCALLQLSRSTFIKAAANEFK